MVKFILLAGLLSPEPPEPAPAAGPMPHAVPVAQSAADVRGELALTDRGLPIYAAAPAAGRDGSAAGGTVAGSTPSRPDRGPADPPPAPPESPPVPAAVSNDSLHQLRPGLTDAQYHDVLVSLTLPNGLVLDRDSDRSTVSSAATGLVGYALAVLADRGVGDRSAVEAHLRRGFETTRAANPAANRGWLAHFTHADGRPKSNSEVSTIDTALFYAGLLRAAQTLGMRDFEAEIRDAVGAVDAGWMTREGVFLHGLDWPAEPGATEPRFIPYTWDDTSEGAIIYRLFGVPFRPVTHRTDLPLFTYFYPLILWPDWDEAGSGRPGGVPWPGTAHLTPGADPNAPAPYAGPDYRHLLAAALKWQHATLGHAGVTAADGPGGYTAFRPTLVSPLMLSSLAPRFAEAADTLRAFDLDATLPAYDLDAGWDAPDRLAIDYASYYLLRAVVIDPDGARTAAPLLAEVE